MLSIKKEFRDRGKNFTEQDKDEFLCLLVDFRSVIDDKKTDTVTVKRKKEIWEQICTKFNLVSQSGTRTVKQLKSLYDNLKQKARKEKDQINKSDDDAFHHNLAVQSQNILSSLSDRIQPIQNPYLINYDELQKCNNIQGIKVEEPEGKREVIDQSLPAFEMSMQESSTSNYYDNVQFRQNRYKRRTNIFVKRARDCVHAKYNYNHLRSKCLRKEHRIKLEVLKEEKRLAQLKTENEKIKREIMLYELKKLKEAE